MCLKQVEANDEDLSRERASIVELSYRRTKESGSLVGCAFMNLEKDLIEVFERVVQKGLSHKVLLGAALS